MEDAMIKRPGKLLSVETPDDIERVIRDVCRAP